MSETPEHLPATVLQHMLKSDQFSAWLGIEVDGIGPGHCTLHFTVREEMLNGFHTLHGGVSYAAADSALAFAANSRGRLSVALSCTMDYMIAGRAGDVLTCTAVEESLQNAVAVYAIKITNQHGKVMGLFKGTVYRTQKDILSV
ncbi:MAG TPA: hotdog fold thioesterase [Flavobacteriales bacterium]